MPARKKKRRELSSKEIAAARAYAEGAARGRQPDPETRKKIGLIRILTTWHGLHLKTAINAVIPGADEKARKNLQRQYQHFNKKRPPLFWGGFGAGVAGVSG